ncbi:hypothetical protein SAMN05920897_107120 [Alkalispirochaeta americana]|uniref:Lipoprotein n=1 Tax=Alkalispirochaeta americana TaxID=159291 RepID=A0A1N6S3A0_9SPIO|nr:hypothetical protein [Alkalispirochaeta americana]SIQ35551.1 hypothetical protein SAMN05920897_107120 [Alkalispirochaeta americana]
MKSIVKKMVVLAVAASALTLAFAACEPIEEGEMDQLPAEQPLN